MQVETKEQWRIFWPIFTCTFHLEGKRIKYNCQTKTARKLKNIYIQKEGWAKQISNGGKTANNCKGPLKLGMSIYYIWCDTKLISIIKQLRYLETEKKKKNTTNKRYKNGYLLISFSKLIAICSSFSFSLVVHSVEPESSSLLLSLSYPFFFLHSFMFQIMWQDTTPHSILHSPFTWDKNQWPLFIGKHITAF